MHLRDAAPERRAVLHLGEQIREEHHLSVARARDEAVFRIACMLDDEARVANTVLPTHALLVALPALSVGWIREHEVEFARRERVIGERRPFGAADNVFGLLAFALEQEIGL